MSWRCCLRFFLKFSPPTISALPVSLSSSSFLIVKVFFVFRVKIVSLWFLSCKLRQAWPSPLPGQIRICFYPEILYFPHFCYLFFVSCSLVLIANRYVHYYSNSKVKGNDVQFGLARDYLRRRFRLVCMFSQPHFFACSLSVHSLVNWQSSTALHLYEKSNSSRKIPWLGLNKKANFDNLIFFYSIYFDLFLF